MASRGPGSSVGLANRGLVAFWLLAVPALAVSAFLWLSQPPEPIAAEVVGSSVTQTDEGLVGEVRWVDEDGVRRVRSFNLTEEQITSGTVLLVNAENQVRVFDPSRDTGPSALTVTVTAVIAMLFAVVVLGGANRSCGPNQVGSVPSDARDRGARRQVPGSPSGSVAGGSP